MPRSKGRPIRKGQILNPEGRRGKGIAKKDVKLLTQEALSKVFNSLVHQSRTVLEAILASKESSGIEAVVAKAIIVDIKEGHMSNLAKVLERIIGPVPQVIKGQYSGPDGIPLLPPSITFAPLLPKPALIEPPIAVLSPVGATNAP